VKKRYEFKDSPQKQRVREELWEPIINYVKDNVAKRFVYLTLPGPKCFELKYFLSKKLIDLEQTISIEKEKPFYEDIQTFYAKKIGLTEKQFPIHHGKIEAIIKSKHHINNMFPLQVVNLDLHGSPFELTTAEESVIFDLIEDIISAQKPHKKELFIFVTVNLASPPAARKINFLNVDSMKQLLLQPVLHATGDKTLSARINNEYKNKKEWLMIYSMILHCLDRVDRNVNLHLVSNPFTYIAANHIKRMLAFALRVTFPNKRPVVTGYYERVKKSQYRKAISIIEKTIWIN